MSATSTQHRILIGSLAAALPVGGHTTRLDLGIDHPAHAGLLELFLTSADGVITAADPVVGAMHRGVEKLFEVRDHRQILMLANRHDWQAPFFGEWAAARVAEQMMGLPVPDRARVLRVIFAEHARVTSHLGQLSWLAGTRRPALRAVRERLRAVLASLSGNRVHPMVTRLGGVAVDITDDRLTELVDAMDRAAALAAGLVVPDALTGVAPVPAGAVDDWGLSGPLARSAGAPFDLRHSDPDHADVTDLLRVHATGGDAASRFTQLIGEVGDSAAIVRRLAATLPDGPVSTRLPKHIRLPEGEGHALVEGALGRTGFRVVSRGGKTPWRMKLRSPSFHHVAALAVLLPGTPIDQVEGALASVGWVAGDLDK